MKCPNCDHETDEDVCPECGTTIMSDPDEMMDAMVQKASIPNLATLFKQGKKRGLIGAVHGYGQSA